VTAEPEVEGEPIPAAPGGFLTPARIEKIGDLSAPLLAEPLAWIERRKESVKILDDTALRREISLDFSLRSASVEPLLKAQDPDQFALYCAPLFVLPKVSGALMGFDLCDEDGRSLRLPARDDNARISAAALIAMVSLRLLARKLTLPDELRERLRDIACSEDTLHAERLAQRLTAGSLSPWSNQLQVIRADERLCWWIRTLAQSSLVVVLYRAADHRRKLIKLSFEENFDSDVRILTRLGWEPYQVAIDSPLIEARSYHLEVTAPPGLRIAGASLIDDKSSQQTDPEHPNARRAHLYRRRAADAGAATALLRLSVSGVGFVSGGFLAASLAFVALLACAIFASRIASNPTSAPALLLVLPGLIASYVGRSDQHALTTRLLSWARYALLFAALTTYVAAARVALDGGAAKGVAIPGRTSALQEWLFPLAGLALVALAILGVTFARARMHLGPVRSYFFGNRVFTAMCVAMSPQQLMAHLRTAQVPRLLPDDYELVDDDDQRVLRYAHSNIVGTRIITCEVDEIDGDAIIGVTLDVLTSLPGHPVLPRTAQRARDQLERRLAALSEWASSGAA